MSVVQTAETFQTSLVDGTARLVQNRLESARKSLLDVGLRNKLIHTNLQAKRSRDITVVGIDADELFEALVEHHKPLSFVPQAGSQNSDDLGQTTGEAENRAVRQVADAIQIRLAPESLDKKLRSLEYEARTIEEEQGVNVLYLAVGFLHWFEDDKSTIDRFAPLVLLPVTLDRDGVKDRYKIRLREDELVLNVSLQAKLSEFGVKLPELPDVDDWRPSQYFNQVAAEISTAPRWSIRTSTIRLGFFSFSKFLLWRDLDTSADGAQQRLCKHNILQKLFSLSDQKEVSQYGDLGEDHDPRRIDDVFSPSQLPYVVDADSSQTVAIQDVLSGRSLVIQGPPGTGKSQTITNIIAAAVKSGKRVLFLAEKMAALNVVHDRLRKVGLSAICLELHSNKVSKSHVHAQLRDALNVNYRDSVPSAKIDQLNDLQSRLNAYIDAVHKPDPLTGRTPYQVVGRILQLRNSGVPSPRGDLIDADNWDNTKIVAELENARQLGRLSQKYGSPSSHPFRGAGCEPLSPLELDELKSRLVSALSAADSLRIALEPARSRFGLGQDPSVSECSNLVQALRHVEKAPASAINLLSEISRDDVVKLAQPLNAGSRLSVRKEELSAILMDDAWSIDWAGDRQIISSHGRSPFRFLNTSFRQSLAKLKGFAKQRISKKHAERLALLDNLIDGKREKEQVAALDPFTAAKLGNLWQGEGTDWNLLTEVCNWVEAAASYSYQVARAPALIDARHAQVEAESIERAALALHERLNDIFDVLKPQDPANLFDRNQPDTLTCRSISLVTLRWVDQIGRLNEWPQLRDLSQWISSLQFPWIEQEVSAGRLDHLKLQDALELAVLNRIWKRLALNGLVARADAIVLDRLVEEFRVADRARASIATKEVARAHFEGLPQGSGGEVGELKNEIFVKKRRHYALRKLINRCGSSIQAIKPVFLMSPLSVAQYVPPGSLKFDLLVIDEASQVRPEDALGAISRASQVVVVGDDKQLPPTSFFMKVIDGDDQDDEADDDLEAVDDGLRAGVQVNQVESILDLCKSFGQSRMLMWHYRSLHPALVAISNRRFYDGKLKLPPAVLRGICGEGIGLEFVRTPEGGYDRGGTRTNQIEADIVAEHVMVHAKAETAAIQRGECERSLGVAAFSTAQRNAIDECIEQRRRADPSAEPFFSKDRPEPFFVKNLENIQGDERDDIYISVGYGRDSQGRLVQNFGMSTAGSERRLNVLITRARRRCRVYSPISADDVRIEPGREQPGKIAFKEFLALAEHGDAGIAVATERGFDSDFEEAVARQIEKLGFEVHTQVGERGFFIDLAVVDPRSPGRYLIGIECDGATYHSSKSARDRDRLRDQILRSRGWTLHRIWSTDWFYRTDAASAKLSEAIVRALDTPLAETRRQKSDHKNPPLATTPAKVAPPPALQQEPPISVPYTEAKFSVGSTDEPHKAPLQLLVNVVTRIVKTEGPIHSEEVARRLASCWGLQRTGSRISDATGQALAAAARAQILKARGEFWSVVDAGPVKPRDRSTTLSQTLRKAEMLPPSEIEATAMEVLQRNIAVEPDNLVVEVARALGFAKTGADLRNVIEPVISKLIARECEFDTNGRARPKR